MWRISSKDGRSWVTSDGGRFTASADMQRVLVDADRPVEIAPLCGEYYQPRGEGDQVAMFLRARNTIGWPQLIAGIPPAALPTPVGPAAGGTAVG